MQIYGYILTNIGKMKGIYSDNFIPSSVYRIYYQHRTSISLIRRRKCIGLFFSLMPASRKNCQEIVILRTNHKINPPIQTKMNKKRKIEARAYWLNTSCTVSSRDPDELARLKVKRSNFPTPKKKDKRYIYREPKITTTTNQ